MECLALLITDQPFRHWSGFYIRIEFSELSRRDAAVTFVMGDCALPPFASPPLHANTGRAGDPGFAQDGAPSVVLVLERSKEKGGPPGPQSRPFWERLRQKSVGHQFQDKYARTIVFSLCCLLP